MFLVLFLERVHRPGIEEGWDWTLARHFNVSKNAWRLPMWFPRSPTVTKLVQLCWYKFSLSPIYSQFLLILKGILLSEKGAMKKSLVWVFIIIQPYLEKIIVTHVQE